MKVCKMTRFLTNFITDLNKNSVYFLLNLSAAKVKIEYSARDMNYAFMLPQIAQTLIKNEYISCKSVAAKHYKREHTL